MLCCAVLSHPVVSDSVTPRTVTHQVPLSMGILQTRILEWIAFPSSRRSSQPGRTQVSRTAGGFFTIWATREAQIMCCLGAIVTFIFITLTQLTSNYGGCEDTYIFLWKLVPEWTSIKGSGVLLIATLRNMIIKKLYFFISFFSHNSKYLYWVHKLHETVRCCGHLNNFNQKCSLTLEKFHKVVC